jgi:glycosyltransferase involved in cell wall biosynthesis
MITFCLPSKNNLRYLKACIPSIQQNSYYKTNKILVFIDEDTDGTEEWLKQNNISYIVNKDTECKGIGNAYDILFKEATTDLVMAFHTDMLLGYHADRYLIEAYKPRSVVCATRIEPPLHPPGPEKIVMDFGMWPEDIKWGDFNSTTKQLSEEYMGKFGKSLFAPWLIDRRDHLGHDDIFKSIYEDADLFRRFVLAEYNIVQVWSSLVYHLTCRSSKFEHVNDNTQFQTQGSVEWQKKNHAMALEYIRKWGGMFREYGPCEPRPNTKYDVGLKIANCSPDLLQFEPYTTNLNVDCETAAYTQHTQTMSSFDIASKFVDSLDNDVMLEFDATQGSASELQYALVYIEDILEQVDAHSTYELGTIKLTIKNKSICNPKIKIN